jgi:hypothetical protein
MRKDDLAFYLLVAGIGAGAVGALVGVVWLIVTVAKVAWGN